MIKVVYLLLIGVSAISAEMLGKSDDSDWAFQWYIGEPFQILCNVSKLPDVNVTTQNLQVKWSWKIPYNGPSFVDNFDVMDNNGVQDGILMIKNVQADYHGVYFCHVIDTDTDVEHGKVVYGLNIHEPLYKSQSERYRHNVIVAVVATSVFLVPVATAFLVWKFQYRTEEQKEKIAMRKQNQKYMYNGSEETKKDIAATVESPEGKGAYENPADTRL